MGMGLFESGWDFSQWTLTDMALAALGAYVVVSMVSDFMKIGRGVRHAAGAPGRGYRSTKKRMRDARRKFGAAIGGTS